MLIVQGVPLLGGVKQWWGGNTSYYVAVSISLKLQEICPNDYICAFDWHRYRWPWMALNSISLNFQKIYRDFTDFGCNNTHEDRPVLSATTFNCQHVELMQFLACFRVARVCQRQQGFLVDICLKISWLSWFISLTDTFISVTAMTLTARSLDDILQCPQRVGCITFCIMRLPVCLSPSQSFDTVNAYTREMVVAWLSGNALVSINVITLHQFWHYLTCQQRLTVSIMRHCYSGWEWGSVIDWFTSYLSDRSQYVRLPASMSTESAVL